MKYNELKKSYIGGIEDENLYQTYKDKMKSQNKWDQSNNVIEINWVGFLYALIYIQTFLTKKGKIKYNNLFSL